MIYHHALSRAIGQAHIEDLIAEATAVGRTSRWRRRRERRRRPLAATPEPLVQRATELPAFVRQD